MQNVNTRELIKDKDLTLLISLLCYINTFKSKMFKIPYYFFTTTHHILDKNFLLNIIKEHGYFTFNTDLL